VAYHSQFGQDALVREEFFPGRSDGVFVDVGAGDGVVDSNTLHFEEEGWSGLLVEADPATFERLKAARRCPAENVACADHRGNLPFRVMPVQGWSGLSGFLRDLEAEELERLQESGEAYTIMVPCLPLQDLLDRHGLPEVDFLSLDVEGAELSVLQSVDWSRTVIRVITVESNRSDSALTRFLLGRGYCLWGLVGPDELYVLKGWWKEECAKPAAGKEAQG
jgi:FkbM family methyltransferase